ncbi:MULTISPECIES: hypothetical protein [unclassified Bradyrhizobium]|uniref:hypothetical protein n=1 Tax=unclassified Bradyrhizobium TaxID=2631580 RepID=UPI0012EB470C|nr:MULTISPECIES: hypothetical protein [unclassified Bradyrhizobium]QIG94494.1 hypothetical protein G6P99_19975 [Bradyrhizobium sp. 6(2017)]
MLEVVIHQQPVRLVRASARALRERTKSGQDWSERTRRFASRVPDLSIFTMGLVERDPFGWRITPKGRAVLAHIESHSLSESSSTRHADALELAGAVREPSPMTPNVPRRTKARSSLRRDRRVRIAQPVYP